jgi:hypothetical protein
LRELSEAQTADDLAAKLNAIGYDPIEGLVGVAESPDSPADLRRRAVLALSSFALPKERTIAISLRLWRSPRREELLG